MLLILFFFLIGRPLQKRLRLRRFKSDRDKIWQECSSNRLYRYALIDGVIFDLTSHYQDSGHDVISRRKVLPPGD